MYNDGIGTMEISKTLNLHRGMIQRLIKKSNIKLRKASPRSHYNVHFFSSYTRENCYWAGFIMADGYIRRTCLHIKLSVKDQEHLQKFLNTINSNYIIRNYDNNCNVDISGPWFLNDLKQNFGIVTRKTFISTYPNIPAEFDKDFIRGLFDGDGCITLTTCPSINFVGTKEILTSLTHKFKNLGVKLKSGNEYPPFQQTNKNIGSIHYSGKNAKLILDWLYSDSTNEYRLNRKYEKFIKLFHIV